MRAPKLVQHMKTNAAAMSDGLIQKIRGSDQCSALSLRVPPEEQKRYASEIYRDLTDWLAAEADAIIEQRYVALGIRRANQGIPFSQLFWAVCIAREHLWEYMQHECLLEEPVEFWGGVMLLRSLNQFFDRALYFTLLGYQKAGKDELSGASTTIAQRQSA
jgi:hypothetical protein